MILIKDHHRTARWDFENDKWKIEDVPSYQWTDIKNNSLSPWFRELNDALQWIKEYDYNRHIG
jgi:hypothetical protein